MLDELARVTAEGFGTHAPAWEGPSFEGRLATYAGFTAEQARWLLAGGDAAAVDSAKKRLRAASAKLGARVRQRLHLRHQAEAVETWILLYGKIGVEVTGDPSGEISVRRCFFADYYSESACGVISALDEGLAEGLFGGASLQFSERLTGGARCCRATLRLGEGR